MYYIVLLRLWGNNFVHYCGISPPDRNKGVYVAYLHPKCSFVEAHNLFEPFGQIISMGMKRFDNMSVARICYSDFEWVFYDVLIINTQIHILLNFTLFYLRSGERAIAEMHNKMLSGRKLMINFLKNSIKFTMQRDEDGIISVSLYSKIFFYF